MAIVEGLKKNRVLLSGMLILTSWAVLFTPDPWQTIVTLVIIGFMITAAIWNLSRSATSALELRPYPITEKLLLGAMGGTLFGMLWYRYGLDSDRELAPSLFAIVAASALLPQRRKPTSKNQV